jgi:uncharacterized protein
MKSAFVMWALFLSVTLSHAQGQKPLAGFWQGSIEAGIPQLLVFAISEKSGHWEGTVSNLYAGDEKLPLAAIKRDGQNVRFELIPGIAFSGTLNERGDEIKGNVEQGATKTPLILKRSDNAPVLSRPQQPKPPFPYRSEDVEIASTAKDVKLAGTLTLPHGIGPHPAVVLISGTGPQDRDEFIMGHRPFAVLADYLTRRGIAVLRCDERGVGKSTGKFPTSTTADFAEDIRAELAWLRTRPEIDKARIGLIGHSEGGIIAPMIAAQDKNMAFIVMMAGVGVPMKELGLRQMLDMAKLSGANERQLARMKSLFDTMLALMTEELDAAAMEKRLRDKVAQLERDLTPEERAKAGDSNAGVQQILRKVRDPQQRWLMRYDPTPALRAVRCPVLALNGKKDVQVAWRENLEAIKRATREGGNRQVKTMALPHLNHLFQTCQTGALKEYGTIEETIKPQVLKVIADWVLAMK